MTTSAAQDEFDALIARNTQGGHSKHPEDRQDDSDVSEPESAGAADDYLEKIDTDDELDIPLDMRSNYYMPSVRSEANTGPKGVIADAQAFEQAKKQARRFTWKKNTQPSSHGVSAWHDEKTSSDEDSEESFMREWRATRLKELQNVGERIRSRTNSPSRRIYGNMPLVDGEGYLDAVDKTASGTTVVVFIYNSDPNAEESQEFEAIMRQVAKRNDTVRFIKMHNDVADIDDAGIPAVLAYKGGEMIADLVPLAKALPVDSEPSAVSFETVFRRHRLI